MKVASLTYELVRGGMLDGVLTHVVGLSSDSPHLSAPTLIEKIVGHQQGMAKFVFLNGDMAGEDPEVMFAFTSALVGFGYTVAVETKGDIFPGWFRNVGHVRVYLKPDTSWLRHTCSEIRLEVESPRDPEPQLPATIPLLYVTSDNVKDAVGFIKDKNRSHKWNVLLKGKSAYTEVLYRAVSASEDSNITLRT